MTYQVRVLSLFTFNCLARLLLTVVCVTTLCTAVAAQHVKVTMTRITPPYSGYRCLQDGGIVRFVDFRKMCVMTHRTPIKK